VKHDTWSDYWRLGELTTLNFFREGYSGELAAFWQELVEGVPEGGRVLDLATGNGAVALLALRHARQLGRTLAIEGVDAARIDPAAHAGRTPAVAAELQAIRFHPQTSFEHTGLPAASFDLVTSQYGIEYGDLSAAAAEIARLLRPGGRFGAILHSAGSEVARTAEKIEALLALLLDELALPVLARTLLQLTAGIRDAAALQRARADAATAQAWAALDHAARRAQAFAAQDEQMRGTTQGFLQRLSAPFDAALAAGPADKQALLEQAEATARGLRQRMAALRAAALDRAGLERLLALLEGAGLAPAAPHTIRFGPLREEMGYAVVARRA
jgi:ubiquinone/menaquinone biosynthesis C-methylase UbiE